MKFWISVLILAIWTPAAQAEVFMVCDSSNTVDKGAYKVVLESTPQPGVELATIYWGQEKMLSYAGHFQVSGQNWRFESFQMENPKLPKLEVYSEVYSNYGVRARVDINSPSCEKLFTDTGIRRMLNLVCKTY